MKLAELSRRDFMHLARRLGVGTGAGLLAYRLLGSRLAEAAPEYRNYQPDRMAYRRLGKTDMMVSAISLGSAVSYGHETTVHDNPSAYRAMLERLLDLGVNFFDTSHSTREGGYGSETYFDVLCSAANRERVFISTKVDDVTYSGTIDAVESSLSEMGTDYIDLVYIHNGRGVDGDDYSGALESFDALDHLIDEGKVHFKGMTAHEVGILQGLLENHSERVDAIMGYYCPMDDWGEWASGTVADWEGLFTLAHGYDVGVVAMKVLASALRPWSERETDLRGVNEAWRRLEPFVGTGASVPQACIQWALSNEEIHSAVLGMRTMAEAEEDVEAVLSLIPAVVDDGPDGGLDGDGPSSDGGLDGEPDAETHLPFDANTRYDGDAVASTEQAEGSGCRGAPGNSGTNTGLFPILGALVGYLMSGRRPSSNSSNKSTKST